MARFYVASYGWKGGAPEATFIAKTPGAALQVAHSVAIHELYEWTMECTADGETSLPTNLEIQVHAERALENPLEALDPIDTRSSVPAWRRGRCCG